MKIGVCTCMNPALPDATGLESLELCRKAGFEYIEAPAAQLLALPEADIDAMVRRIRESGFPCLGFNNLFQAKVRLTGPEVDDGLVDAYIDRVVDVGSRLGVETMVFGSSYARNVPMHFPMEKAWDQLVGMLRRFAPKAEKIGVTIVIEHLNHFESNIVDFFREGVRLVREVDHPSVRCLIDFYHLDLGNESLDLVDEHFDLIRHAHFANVMWRTIPTTSLHEPRGLAFLDLLKRKNYQYKLSIEGYGKELERQLPESAALLRGRM